jgi:hypothetical protein
MESNMTDTLKIEAGKEYLLRNGWRMRCYATDGARARPIHGAYQTASGVWEPESWARTGRVMNGGDDDRRDIISPAPETIEVDCWLWVYASGTADALSSKFRGPPDSIGAPAAQIHIKRSIPVGEGM